MTSERFRELMAMMMALYGHQLQDSAYKLYWALFKGRTDEEFQRMCEKVVETFTPTAQVPFPVPATFLKAAGEDPQSRARAAVGAVIAAAAKLGPYRSVSFGDPALHATIQRFGGWVEVCGWSQEDWKYSEKRFVESYAADVAAGVGGPARLVGIAERGNAARALSGRMLELATAASAPVLVDWAGAGPMIEDKTQGVELLECVAQLAETIKSV